MTPRKLTFHLTPLLDLLLIVIFAQFLEVRDTTAAQEQQSTKSIARAEQDFDAAEQELTQLRTDRRNAQAALAKLEQELTLLQDVASELTVSQEDLEKKLAAAREQRDRVAGLMSDVFDLPADTIEELIPLRTGQDVLLSPEERERLKKRVREYSGQNPQAALQHLLTFEELRKRCDIWELYVGADGMTTFTADNVTQQFRAETPEEFESRLFDCYKRLPQPKSLVLMLLSHGNVKRANYLAALRGLPRATDRMRQDQSGRSRFEYTVIGSTQSTEPTR